MRAVFFASVFMCMAVAVGAQECLWAKAEGGDTRSGALRMNQGTGICTDDSGHVYAAGFFYGVAGFGPDSLRNYSSWNGLLVKYDSAGNVLWARQATHEASCAVTAVCTDRQHHVIVTGYRSGQGISSFTAMYDAGGSRIWYRNNDTPGASARTRGIATDRQGNIYVLGDCQGAMRLDTFSIGEYELYTIFLVKYSPSGNIMWIRHSQPCPKYYTQASALTIDAKDNIYLTGSFDSAFTIDKAKLKSKGGPDVFVMKYSTAGKQLQTWAWGSAAADRAGSITTDAQGNVYTTAYFMADAAVGGKQVIAENIMKLNPSGKLLWNYRVGIAKDNYLLKSNVAVTPAGVVYIAGYAYYSIPLLGEAHCSNMGAADMFIAKLSAAGKLEWKLQAGSERMDECDAICVDAKSNVYVTGYFHGIIRIGDKWYIKSHSGDDGMFVAKLKG